MESAEPGLDQPIEPGVARHVTQAVGQHVLETQPFLENLPGINAD